MLTRVFYAYNKKFFMAEFFINNDDVVVICKLKNLKNEISFIKELGDVLEDNKRCKIYISVEHIYFTTVNRLKYYDKLKFIRIVLKPKIHNKVEQMLYLDNVLNRLYFRSLKLKKIVESTTVFHEYSLFREFIKGVKKMSDNRIKEIKKCRV